MSKYRVTLLKPVVEVIDAANHFMAAVVASARHGDGTEVVDVRPHGTTNKARSTKSASRTRSSVKKTAKKAARPAKKVSRRATKATKKAVRPAKKAAKKRQLSPEARAKLVANLAKARAARAKKLQGAKRGR